MVAGLAVYMACLVPAYVVAERGRLVHALLGYAAGLASGAADVARLLCGAWGQRRVRTRRPQCVRRAVGGGGRGSVLSVEG